MPRLAALALVSALLALAGCGGSTSSGGDDPASLVPANAPVYFEATLRPDGDLRDGALDAAGKVLHTDDPQKRIDELVKEAFADTDEDGGLELDYARDVKPWLGEKAGVWAVSTEDGQDDKAVAILSATDTDKAQQAIDRLSKESEKKFSKKSYKDVSYKVNGEGDAVGIVEDFAVFGTEAEFKRTIQAADGDGLADDKRYKDAIGELSDDRLAHFYVDAKALVDQALRQQDASERQQTQQFLQGFQLDKLGPIAAGFSADGSRLAIDGFTSGSGSDYFKKFGALTGTGSTPLLGELPGDSWGALGAPKLGETARALYQQFAGALGGAAIAQQLRSQLGLDLEQDVFSWIGDVAFFVRGTSPDAIDGGAVIEVTDQAKAKAAFGKLVGVLQSRGGVSAKPLSVDGASQAFELSSPGAPQKVVAALGDERMAIGYGRKATEDALSPDEKLADGDAYGEAKSLLGDDIEPGFVLAMPAVVTLAEAMSGSDPDFAKAKPYLEAFSLIASGGKLDDDRARSRFAAGLK
jgi:Protein of unknown function (DUF3352)